MTDVYDAVNPAEEPVASSPAQFSSSVQADGTVLAILSPPVTGPPNPIDLVFVLDTSGSMGSNAEVKGAADDGGGKLSVYQLVAHASLTILESMREFDRASIVCFASRASTILPLKHMTAAGKAEARRVLESQDPDGSTNLWAGIVQAFDALKPTEPEADASRQKVIVLLTDGCPNVNPLRGHIPELKAHKAALGSWTQHVAIHTFGFGYELDTQLLLSIAEECSGSFGFISTPDMVGTVFVNAAANILSYSAGDWAVEPSGQRIGKLVYGQPRAISIPSAAAASSSLAALRIADDSCASAASASAASASSSLRAVSPHNGGTVIESDSTAPISESELQVQLIRLKVIRTIKDAWNKARINSMDEARSVVRDAIAEIHAHPLASVTSDARVVGLLADLEGEVSMAVSRDEVYMLWGKHYLPSLMRAHELQICANFKDPGLQLYGGASFKQMQEAVSATFLTIAAPEPRVGFEAQFGGYGGMRGHSAPAPFAAASAASGGFPPMRSMASYYNPSGPCFHGAGVVQMADGSTKKVMDIVPGDKVMASGYTVNGAMVMQSTPARVSWIIKTKCAPTMNLVLLQNGLLITEFHPLMADENRWMFPRTLAEEEKIHRVAKKQVMFSATQQEFEKRGFMCPHVYSFALGSIEDAAEARIPFGVTVDNRVVITLAHDIQNHAVLTHAYYGSAAVLKDLEGMQSVAGHSGLVELNPGCVKVDPETQLVSGLIQVL